VNTQATLIFYNESSTTEWSRTRLRIDCRPREITATSRPTHSTSTEVAFSNGTQSPPTSLYSTIRFNAFQEAPPDPDGINRTVLGSSNAPPFFRHSFQS